MDRLATSWVHDFDLTWGPVQDPSLKITRDQNDRKKVKTQQGPKT